jgi:hypothetical protein
MTDTEEYKTLGVKYMKLLRASIETDEVDDDENNSKVRKVDYMNDLNA